MILLINLLIAIMSDEYASLSFVRTGLYWGSVIDEMPKYVYNKKYGSLTMFPFSFSFVSIIALPFLLCTSKRESLIKINNICFFIIFLPVSIIVSLAFIAVNLILLPIAYLKTVAHKALLFRRYKGSYHCTNLFSYIALGIPMLLVSQFTDVYYFIHHTYSTNNLNKEEVQQSYKFDLSIFQRFRALTNKKIEQGITLMNATEFVCEIKEKTNVMPAI